MKLSKQEFLSLSGMEHDTLNTWIEEEWLVPRGSSVEPSFSEIDIARVQLIRDLQVDFGVNDEGVA
jgi:chaperone modulatory protein CbpM